MAKIEIKFLNDNGEVTPKDDLLKSVLQQYFDEQPDDYEGHGICEQIIEAAKKYGFIQMAVQMIKDLKSSETYQVMLMHE